MSFVYLAPLPKPQLFTLGVVDTLDELPANVDLFNVWVVECHSLECAKDIELSIRFLLRNHEVRDSYTHFYDILAFVYGNQRLLNYTSFYQPKSQQERIEHLGVPPKVLIEVGLLVWKGLKNSKGWPRKFLQLARDTL